MADSKMHYLFVGNPGVGKSTILNGLLGECKFKSGFSPGQGMTYELQKEHVNGDVYMDTPGLADVALRKQAAAAITTALKQNGSYRIFFVLTTEAGRVRPADKATMELILGSAPIKQNYGVIFNKLSPAAKKRIDEDPKTKELILASLFTDIPATNFVNYCAKDNDLEDADNVVRPLSESLQQFIRNMPPIVIKPEAVKEIKGDDFEQMNEKYEKMLQQMEKNSEVLRKQLETQSQQMKDQQDRMEQQARESAELRQQMMNMAAQQGQGGRTEVVPICSVM